MTNLHSYPLFIVIDDDDVNNVMCKLFIKSVSNEIQVKTFKNPDEGLDFIQNFHTQSHTHSIVLLDINMLGSTGWEFLNKFNEFDKSIKELVSIYMLSSSVDPKDKERASNHHLVERFITKPINLNIVHHIINQP